MSTVQTISVFSPNGDTSLYELNTQLKGLRREQFIRVQVSPFRNGHWITVYYTEHPEIQLVNASFGYQHSVLTPSLVPSTWYGLVSEKVGAVSAASATVDWYFSDGTSSGSTGVSLSHNGRVISCATPAVDGGFEGTLTLVISGLTDDYGNTSAPIRAAVTIVPSSKHINETGHLPDATVGLTRGRVKMARLIASPGVNKSRLVANFLQSTKIESRDLVDIQEFPNLETGAHHIFIVWYDLRLPRITGTSPQNNATVSKPADEGYLFVSFAEPVPASAMTGSGFIYLNEVDISTLAITVEDVSTNGTMWMIYGAPLATEGCKCMVIDDLEMDNAIKPFYQDTLMISWQVIDFTAGGGSSTLEALTDTTITSVGDGELLVYDSGTSKWINQTLAEAGVSATGHTHDDRYYTESEVDTLLAGKSSTSHTHSVNDLSDVTITSVGTTEYLQYSGSAWINRTPAEAGVRGLVGNHYLAKGSMFQVAGSFVPVAPGGGPGVTVLQASTPASTTQTNTLVAEIGIPINYDPAVHSILIRVNAGVNTPATVSETLDMQVYSYNNGGSSSDLCTTTAYTLSGAGTDYDFTITDTGLDETYFLTIFIDVAQNNTAGGAPALVDIFYVSMLIS